MLKKCFNCDNWVEVDTTQKEAVCPTCGANNLFHYQRSPEHFFLAPYSAEAMEFLEEYMVQTHRWKKFIVVTEHTLGQDDFRLAEMCFQMNWHQKSGVCPLCQACGEKNCGHLTFTRLVR